MKDLKRHTSIEEQIQILQGRGLIVKDVARARALLSSTNYYRLTGYLCSFKVPGSDEYQAGTSLIQIKRIYDFDRRLIRILMYALEDIEESLKTRLSYCVTSRYPQDPIIYLKSDPYRNYGVYLEFLKHFYKEVENNRKLPFVKHHVEEYNGLLPMWVAVELLTMGNLHAFYDNLLPEHQKAIARTYETGPRQLSSWIENLTYTRNHLAHYMRVYDFDFGRTPTQCVKHHKYTTASHRIFDQIYIISFLYSDATEWNNYIIPALCDILREYQDDIDIKKLGFPDDWMQILTRQ